MQFDHFGMTKAKNETMKKMCQLVSKVKDPNFLFWTISRHDLEFILKHDEVEQDDKILLFVLDAVYDNQERSKMKTSFFDSLGDFMKDVHFLQLYLLHMQKIVKRSSRTGQPAFTNLEALVGPVVRSEADYEQSKKWWAKESGFESLLEEVDEDDGEEEVDEHDGEAGQEA